MTSKFLVKVPVSEGKDGVRYADIEVTASYFLVGPSGALVFHNEMGGFTHAYGRDQWVFVETLGEAE